MTGVVSEEEVNGPVSSAGPGGSTVWKEFVDQFSPPTATALVIGSIIGTRIFALPPSLAVFGTSSLVAFGLVTVGALALAALFGWLTAGRTLSP